jgi:hypothetical protein
MHHRSTAPAYDTTTSVAGTALACEAVNRPHDRTEEHSAAASITGIG